MVVSLVRLKSRFSTSLQLSPSTYSVVRVLYLCWITSSHTIHPQYYEGLLFLVSVKPPNVKPRDSVENRDSHDKMRLGRYGLIQTIQLVIFNSLSYCFEEIIGFDVKASFASRSVSRLIRWYIKPGDTTKEFWEKAI